MTIIHLPEDLTAVEDAAELNAKVRAGDAEFDWSDVRTIDDDILATLLSGLDLAEHADELGLGSVPSSIEKAVTAALPTGDYAEPEAPVNSPSTLPTAKPATWRAPEASEAPKAKRVAAKDGLTPLDVRRHLVRALEADLVGPFQPDEGGHETLPLSPSRWYLTGFLAPDGQREQDDPDADDEMLGGNDEDDIAQTAQPDTGAKKKRFFPASMGITVLVPASTTKVTAVVSYADYTVIEEQGSADDEGVELGEDGRVPFERVNWMRSPRRPVPIELSVEDDALKSGVVVPNSAGLEVTGEVKEMRAPGLPDGTKAVSLFLVNRRQPMPALSADEAFVFQTSLAVRTEAGLVARPNMKTSNEWDDRLADVQFRNNFEFAVGHGVGVEVIREAGAVVGAKTQWIPSAEVKPITTRDVEDVTTEMRALSELNDGAEAKAKLLPLVDAYAEWIGKQADIQLEGAGRLATQQEIVRNANRACARIKEGIELLSSDAQVLEAFRLANHAMALAQEKDRTGQTAKWRLFQLAFVLMNLPSIHDEAHEDRETVELIFFPTGGGKTQAYLGVIAFTLVLRRLRGVSREDGGLGTAVILRYTLRLLTLDQLGRASTLICALEVLRRERKEALGETRFAIGLWVGRTATANTLYEVSERLTEYKNRESDDVGSPFPLATCPWCKEPLQKRSFSIVTDAKKKPVDVKVSCSNFRCAFAGRSSDGGLPVLFVDEQIYKELPCFLISTVDKFALLPWRGETGKLFGHVVARDGTQFIGPADKKPGKQAERFAAPLRPPELIVQDELHLISGPLGTMVGLYETAIDELCARNVEGHRYGPKVLASTATVRRAKEQIQSLFGRDRADVFPPAGVNAQETFFAVVEHDAPGRQYLGIAAGGQSMKKVLLRAYISALGSAQRHFNESGAEKQAADSYMTLAGYFNSLRELGGMRRLVEDEVHTQLQNAKKRVPLSHHGHHPWVRSRKIGEPVELTSREPTHKVKDTKDRLSRPHVEKNNKVDVLLASNMISVGVDIDRLGLMVVAGQPKSTNEYIQATSRVGRDKTRPGLVITAFNLHRPRDRSHYERFTAFHDSFYRFVEATSVTPFSGPALDRGLAGLLVALTRHLDDDMASPGAVMDLKDHRERAEEVVRSITNRAVWERSRSESLNRAQEDEVRKTLERRGMHLLDEWEKEMRISNDEAAADRCYSPWDPDGKGRALLRQAIEAKRSQRTTPLSPRARKFVAPTSMRDVEESVHVWVERRPLDGGR